MANTNRTRGHNYERLWVQRYKQVGFSHCKTSRAASRLLDNAKVDLAFIPFNHQCKKVKTNINYFKLLKEIEVALKESFPPGERQLEYPIIISHDKGKGEEIVVMHSSTYLNLLSQISELQLNIKNMNEQHKGI